MRERPFQFVELLSRPVQFHSHQVSDLERFGEQRPNVVQMGENTLSVGVGFAAEDFIAADREPVEKILLLTLRLLDEGWERGFESRKFSWMNFKVRLKANEVRQGLHS